MAIQLPSGINASLATPWPKTNMTGRRPVTGSRVSRPLETEVRGASLSTDSDEALIHVRNCVSHDFSSNGVSQYVKDYINQFRVDVGGQGSCAGGGVGAAGGCLKADEDLPVTIDVNTIFSALLRCLPSESGDLSLIHI